MSVYGGPNQDNWFDSIVIGKTGRQFIINKPGDAAVINLSGITLEGSTNVIRGINITPTRASGWISFTGTVTNSPADVYSDYRELHTNGTARVLGIGSFPFMDSGASCASMNAGQFICEVDAGATVLTAAAAPGIGIFPLWAKCLLNGETFNSGGVAAAMFLSVQANVTDVSTQNVSLINMENASGKIKNIFFFKDTVGVGVTNLFEFPTDAGVAGPVSLTNGSILNDISATANAGWIRVLIGSTTRYLPLYALKA